MHIRLVTIPLVTDAAEACTAYSAVVNGLILALRLDIGTLTTPQLAVTLETTGVAVLTDTSIAASSTWQPRPPTHDEATGAELLRWAAGNHVGAPIPVANERIKAVIASGGDTKTGTLYAWIAGH